MSPWLLVSGDFTPLGGMDRANHALASHLAGLDGGEVHLVTHRAWPDLSTNPAVSVHKVARPMGRQTLGEPLLAAAGRRWARRLAGRGARVVVNGGNCRWGDINWVHYVHAAWRPDTRGERPVRRAKLGWHARSSRRAERSAVSRARLVIANSERTRAALIEGLGVPAGRVRTVYYGTDPDRFSPPTPEARAESRRALGVAEGDGRPLVAFVGALGDRRKGFDTLFDAWTRLARGDGWDARLVVVGTGATLPAWRDRAASDGLGDSIRFLGFREDVPAILAGSDLLVSPARYEAYGLNVQEALCVGLPAIVSLGAGVAERYPDSLRHLLLPDPDDAADLAGRLAAWRGSIEASRAAVEPFGRALRSRGWDRCAAEIVGLAEGRPA